MNEWASDVEQREFDGGTLCLYPCIDLVAEKFRALIQQPIRKRSRFQDVYDIFLLVSSSPPSKDEKEKVLEKLRQASEDRQVEIFPDSLRGTALIRLSRKGYDNELPGLIGGTPPSIDDAYTVVRELYESLPWTRFDQDVDNMSK